MADLRKVRDAVVLGMVIGVAVTVLGGSGVVAMAIYAAWVDDQTAPRTECECCV